MFAVHELWRISLSCYQGTNTLRLLTSCWKPVRYPRNHHSVGTFKSSPKRGDTRYIHCTSLRSRTPLTSSSEPTSLMVMDDEMIKVNKKYANITQDANTFFQVHVHRVQEKTETDNYQGNIRQTYPVSGLQFQNASSPNRHAVNVLMSTQMDHDVPRSSYQVLHPARSHI